MQETESKASDKESSIESDKKGPNEDVPLQGTDSGSQGSSSEKSSPSKPSEITNDIRSVDTEREFPRADDGQTSGQTSISTKSAE